MLLLSTMKGNIGRQANWHYSQGFCRISPKSELKAPTLSMLGFSGTAATAAAVLMRPPLMDAPVPFPESRYVCDVVRHNDAHTASVMAGQQPEGLRTWMCGRG